MKIASEAVLEEEHDYITSILTPIELYYNYHKIQYNFDDYKNKNPIVEEYFEFLEEFYLAFPDNIKSNSYIYEMINAYEEVDELDDFTSFAFYYMENISDFTGDLKVSDEIMNWIEDIKKDKGKDYSKFFIVFTVKEGQYVYKYSENSNEREINVSYNYNFVNKLEDISIVMINSDVNNYFLNFIVKIHDSSDIY